MLTFRLERMHQDSFATYGHLIDVDEKQWGVTLERPWVDNAHDVSCIPPGAYPAHRYHSPKRGYDVFLLSGVPHRADIELHIGNLPHDSEGCILIGSNFGTVNGQPGITGSAAAFARFMDHLRTVDTFTLVVSDPAPLVAVSSPSSSTQSTVHA